MVLTWKVDYKLLLKPIINSRKAVDKPPGYGRRISKSYERGHLVLSIGGVILEPVNLRGVMAVNENKRLHN